MHTVTNCLEDFRAWTSLNSFLCTGQELELDSALHALGDMLSPQVLAKTGANASSTAMVEDSLKNLRQASQLFS